MESRRLKLTIQDLQRALDSHYKQGVEHVLRADNFKDAVLLRDCYLGAFTPFSRLFLNDLTVLDREPFDLCGDFIVKFQEETRHHIAFLQAQKKSMLSPLRIYQEKRQREHLIHLEQIRKAREVDIVSCGTI